MFVPVTDINVAKQLLDNKLLVWRDGVYYDLDKWAPPKGHYITDNMVGIWTE